jgi:hypothetical protein
MANRRKSHKHRPAPYIRRLSLYDGQIFEGYVIDRNGRWHAFTAAGESLGNFPNMESAAHAVTAHAHSRGEVAA